MSEGNNQAYVGSEVEGQKGSYDYRSPQNPQLQSPVARAQAILKADAEHRSLSADQILMLRAVMQSWGPNERQLQQGLYQWFRHQGFWPANWNPKQARWSDSSLGDTITIPYHEYVLLKKAEKIALIHSEVTEMLEAVRKGDHENEVEEFADIQVRMADYAGGFALDTPSAFEGKMYKNYARPAKHGKAF